MKEQSCRKHASKVKSPALQDAGSSDDDTHVLVPSKVARRPDLALTRLDPAPQH